MWSGGSARTAALLTLLALWALVDVQASSSLEWAQLPVSSKPPPRSHYAVATWGSTIYIHGGLWEGKMMLSDLWRLDKSKAQLAWEKLSASATAGHDFPTARQRHSMILSPDGKYLYLFGGLAFGFDDTNDARDQGGFFRLDLTAPPAALFWEESWAKLLHADSAMVWWGSQILVYGGFCRAQETSGSCESNWLHTLDAVGTFTGLISGPTWVHQPYVGQPPPVYIKPVMVTVRDTIYVLSPDRLGYEQQGLYTLTPTSCSTGSCPLQWGVLPTASKGPLYADSMVSIGNTLWVWGGVHGSLFTLDLGVGSPLSWDDATPSASTIPSNVEEGQSRMVAVDGTLVAFAGVYDLEAFQLQLKCAPGTFGAEGSIHCHECPAGTFSSSYGATSCTQCATGLCTHGLEYSCPPASRSDALCIQCTQDLCTQGEFRTGCTDHADSSCQQCSSGGCDVGEYRSPCANFSDGSCTKCTEGGCGPGMYRTACTQDADGVCMLIEEERAAILSVRLDTNAAEFSRSQASFLLSVSRVLQQDLSTIVIVNVTSVDLPDRRADDGGAAKVLEVIIAVMSSGPAGVALVKSKLTPMSINAQLEADRVELRAVQSPQAAPQPGPAPAPQPRPAPEPPLPPQPGPHPETSPLPIIPPLPVNPSNARPRNAGPDESTILLWVLLSLGVSALAFLFMQRRLLARRRRLAAQMGLRDLDGESQSFELVVMPGQSGFPAHVASPPAAILPEAPSQPATALSSSSPDQSRTTILIPAALHGQVQESDKSHQGKSTTLKQVDAFQKGHEKEYEKMEYCEAGASTQPPKSEDSDDWDLKVAGAKETASFDEGWGEAAGAREGAAQNPKMESP